MTLTLPSRVTEGCVFYVSGQAIMSVGMKRRRMTGHHRQRTGKASYYYYMCGQIEALQGRMYRGEGYDSCCLCTFNCGKQSYLYSPIAGEVISLLGQSLSELRVLVYSLML